MRRFVEAFERFAYIALIIFRVVLLSFSLLELPYWARIFCFSCWNSSSVRAPICFNSASSLS